jgi:Protein of unknown function (DUF2793)
MKTHNYEIELMTPQQTDKEVIFNEAQSTIDSFCGSTVFGVSEVAPDKPEVGTKYLLVGKNKRNHICYCPDINSGWKYLPPKPGMMIYIRHLNNFYIFENDAWTLAALKYVEPEIPNKFTGIENDCSFKIIHKISYLYLSNNCKLSFTDIAYSEFTVIIKQNVGASYNLTWPENIIWPKKIPHKVTAKPNSIDAIAFCRLAESDRFLARVVEVGYEQ